MATDKIKVGIVGSAGYTAGELLRILVHHTHAEPAFVYSTSSAGKPVSSIHTDLVGETDLAFSDTLAPADVVFLCLGHGISRSFLAENQLPATTKVIDLGNDFRLDAHFNQSKPARNFVYGLPEVNRELIQQAQNVANPGCFATAIQLALLPLAKSGMLTNEVHINATTGSTGAGRSLSETSHFSYRSDNISTYKVFSHQHLGEIKKTLAEVQTSATPGDLNFVPVRGNFTRGIFATLYTKSELSEEQAVELYQAAYANHPFTHVATSEVCLKDVVNTNKCLLHIKKYDDKLFITSVIDNLLKGASGQAVQNMNLLFGFDEACGLGLKPSGF